MDRRVLFCIYCKKELDNYKFHEASPYMISNFIFHGTVYFKECDCKQYLAIDENKKA